MSKNKLSIIIPVYYNEMNIPSLYEDISKNLLKSFKDDYEIIMVDDGSKDNSYLEMQKLAKRDKNIKLVKLSRNFGSHAAVLAGMSHATGDCITVKAADLQEPVEIILEMYNKWLEGNNVVLAVRKDREEPLSQKLFANFYYNVLRKFGLKNMPKGGFDCFLIDKKVAKNLCEMKEKNTTLMGQIIWCGYKTASIYYVRKKRTAGKSKWTFGKKVKLFVDSIIGFSYIPIRMITVIGTLFFMVSVIWILVLLLTKILGGIAVSGWTSLMILNLFSSGLIMIILGILGEYLWRNFDETRKRPPFIVEETQGIEVVEEKTIKQRGRKK